jgi:integrase
MNKPKGIFLRHRTWWAKVKTVEGHWTNRPTPFSIDNDPDGVHAAGFRAAVQDGIDAGAGFKAKTGALPTVKNLAEKWIKTHRRGPGPDLNPPEPPLVASWKDDVSRLKTHVYPQIGALLLRDVKPKHVAEVVAIARNKKLAPRTLRNVYAIMQALFRDAEIDGLVASNPCILGKSQLGKIRDNKTEWRATAIFTREELEKLISNPQIPWDRRILYALLGLGALRHGEAAALRWRHVVSGLEPLGRLIIANSNGAPTTKTGAERWMPIHPVLAAMLAEWKLSGWPAAFDRIPQPDDLIVPHTRPTNKGPRVKFGGMRADHDSYKRFHLDLDALGMRKRRVHDLRRTAITVYRDAGADKDILRRCTHQPARDVLEQYTSFEWAKLCAQIQPLQIDRKKAG